MFKLKADTGIVGMRSVDIKPDNKDDEVANVVVVERVKTMTDTRTLTGRI